MHATHGPQVVIHSAASADAQLSSSSVVVKPSVVVIGAVVIGAVVIGAVTSVEKPSVVVPSGVVRYSVLEASVVAGGSSAHAALAQLSHDGSEITHVSQPGSHCGISSVHATQSGSVVEAGSTAPAQRPGQTPLAEFSGLHK